MQGKGCSVRDPRETSLCPHFENARQAGTVPGQVIPMLVMISSCFSNQTTISTN